MSSVPVKNGKPCVFRVVHVSGTMRKAEEEAIRRARNLIFAAENGHKEKARDSFSNMFGEFELPQREIAMTDLLDVGDDGSDVEMGELSDG